jgi:multidrug efflux system outer membrane protein
VTRLLALLLPLILAGCWAVGPDYYPPATPPLNDGFHAADSGQTTTDDPPERWWEGLHDAVLDQLIARALVGNLDLKLASANLLAARASRDIARAAQFPSLNASASYARARESAATLVGNPNIAEPDVNLTELGFSLAWEADLFGRVRRAVEAGEADSGQSQALRRQIVILTIAEVASTYIDLRGTQSRLAVADNNTRNQQRTFQLTETLSDAGRGTDLDVARARAQLESTVATIPPLRGQLAADKHQLALLIGATPDALDALLDTPAPLPALPEFLPVGNPTTLLRRRPDIAAAERAVAGATARVGVATADLYPNVSFTALPGLQALQPGDLGKKGAFAYSVGPSLSLPVFDLSVYAQLRVARANEQAALASFQKSVLNALAETETALDLYAQEGARRQSLRVAAEASGRAAELANTRYLFGAENFLAVLDAEAKQLAAEDQLAQSEILCAQDLITIYRALGGGWSVVPSEP